MRLPTESNDSARRIAVLALFAGVTMASVAMTGCGSEPTAAGATARVAHNLSFSPVFPKAFTASTNYVAVLVPFNRVRVVMQHSDTTVALDTAIVFPAGADSIAVSLSVTLLKNAPAAGEPMNLRLAYVNATSDTVFRGGAAVTVVAAEAGQAPPPPISVPVDYTGPGSDAARVSISPRSVVVFDGQPFSFSAQVFNATGGPVSGTPTLFSSTDSTLALIPTPGSGRGVARDGRGRVRIVAQLINGLADTATLDLQPTPSAFTLVAGNGQVAMPGDQLAHAVTVRVTAADQLGVAGVALDCSASNGGSTGLTRTVTDAAGYAQLTWTLGVKAGPQTLSCTADGINGSTLIVEAMAKVPGGPPRLSILAQPSGVLAGATMPAILVRVHDALGTMASLTGNVTISFAANPSGARLLGTTTVALNGGDATFSDLAIDKPGSGYRLVATAAGIIPDTSAVFSIEAPGHTAATGKLAIVAQPGRGVAGGKLSPAMLVRALTAGGALLPLTGNVSVSLLASPQGAKLGGTATAAARDGVVTFGDLSLEKAGSYTFLVSATGIAPDTSASFTIEAGPAANLAIAGGNDQSGKAGKSLSAPLAVMVTDSYGNPVAGVTIAWLVADGGGSLSAPRSVTNFLGIATASWKLGVTPAGSRSAPKQVVTASIGGFSNKSEQFRATVVP